MEILQIAAGVTLGGILAGIFLLCARHADEYEDWSQVPGMTSVGFIVPLVFVFLMLYLANQEVPGPEQRGGQVRLEFHDQ